MVQTPDVKTTRKDNFLFWLVSTGTGKIVVWLMELVAFVFGLLVAMLTLYMAESRFFPVIVDWKLDALERHGEYYEASGSLNKVRGCELLSVSVLAVPKVPLVPRQVLFQIKPSDIDGGNVPTGVSTWGPWSIKIPKTLEQHRDKVSRLDVIATHRCHAFWTQETEYGSIPIERIQ